MRVLHIIPSVAERSGGPAQAILPMCRALQEQGTDVLIATTDAGLEKRISNFETQNRSYLNHKAKPEIQSYKGVTAIFFPAQWGSSFKYSRGLAVWLAKQVRSFEVVHIHAVFNHACVAAVNACRRQGVPYVIRPLGTLDPWSMKHKSWRKGLFWHIVGKRMLKGAAAVHYTHRSEKEGAELSLGLHHGRVVPLGVEVDRFGNGSHSPSFLHLFPAVAGHPYVLALSRLHPKKGLDVLLEAFLSLSRERQFSDWRLILAGEGPREYVARLKQTVAAENAREIVLFPGWLEGDTKVSALRHAALLTLPSHHENFGLCVIEALASGVPVLVSPGVNLALDIQAAEAGWIATVDVEAVVAALREALCSQDERRQRGRNGKSLASKFDWPVIAKDLASLYTQVSLQGPGRA